MRNCLVLVQHRNDASSAYNDFVGKFYHFPGNAAKSYLNQFKNLPIEFVYYEPTANGGKGEYFGCGKITKAPFEDKREKGFYFVEIEKYKSFNKPVPFKDANQNHVEKDNPHYNSQNAVRKIDSKLLDEICLDGEIILNFTADAHLVKVLGEQLIASEKVGILELVKNAYDAHATKCIVRIEKAADLPPVPADHYTYSNLEGPVVIIEDNGSGMSKEALENGWLRPAATIKTNIKEQLKSERNRALEKGSLASYDKLVNELKIANKGRIPLGEKGVGRFATHRLGKKLIIKSKVENLDYEYVLQIDWDKFDAFSEQGVDLESVGVNLKRQPPSWNYGPSNSGTQVIIYGGREGFKWDKEKVEDLNRSIIQLNSPNPNPKAVKLNFQASLEVPQIPDLEADIMSLFTATFELSGLVDEKGIFDYSLEFTPPSSVPLPAQKIEGETINLVSANKAYWGKNPIKRTECGPFYINLKLWYRKSPWISGPNKDAFITYLDSYGGISIYRDGINIFPAEWGANNDWLGLSKAHIKQGFRFSYYNMIGNIEIDQGSNLLLTDKTDREGLIENTAQKDLVALVKGILDGVLHNEWIGKRDEHSEITKDTVRDPKVLKEYSRQAAHVAHNILERYPLEKDQFGILEGLGQPDERREKLVNLERSLKELQQSLDLIQESQEMLTEQAGYGIAIASSIHEIAKITSNFYFGINEVLKKDKIDREKLSELKESSSSLRNELKRLSPLRAIKGEKPQAFNISRPIKYALDVYESKLKEIGISVELNTKEDFPVYVRYGTLIQIFTNLLDNACYWLEMTESAPKRISVQLDKKSRSVIFADSGPGIHESILPHLFKAGFSLKIPRSGLGLYITRYYMNDFKGDIQLINSPKYRLENLKGAQFLLDFAKVRAEK